MEDSDGTVIERQQAESLISLITSQNIQSRLREEGLMVNPGAIVDALSGLYQSKPING